MQDEGWSEKDAEEFLSILEFNFEFPVIKIY